MTKPDSLIFDMDGTLWDNVDTYVMAWKNAFAEKGYGDVSVARDDLMQHMGKEISDIMRYYLPDVHDAELLETLYAEVFKQYHLLVPTMQPHVFDGVYRGLEQLAKKYKLFMLSNCEKDGITHFMQHTGTRAFFVDFMEWGMNEMPKSHNLKLLKEKHALENPMYVGDTDSDSRETMKAGFPFVFAAYGFGDTQAFDLCFNSFQDLTNYFLHI